MHSFKSFIRGRSTLEKLIRSSRLLLQSTNDLLSFAATSTSPLFAILCNSHDGNQGQSFCLLLLHEVITIILGDFAVDAYSGAKTRCLIIGSNYDLAFCHLP